MDSVGYGYWIDYSRFEIGLSEKRANWLIKFVENLQGDGWLTGVRQFQEFHGRLGFASQVLLWLKPLLGPGYAWLSAVAKATTLKVPELLAITCIFIKEKFSSGLRKLPCGCREEHIGEIFRTDTKCADGRVILGVGVRTSRRLRKVHLGFLWRLVWMRPLGYSGARKEAHLGRVHQ